jgi:hypothetical protein
MEDNFMETLPELDATVDAKLTELFEKEGTSEQVQEYTRFGVRSLALGADELKGVVGSLPALLGGEKPAEPPEVKTGMAKSGSELPDLANVPKEAKPYVEMLLKKSAENEKIAKEAMAKAAKYEEERQVEVFGNKAKDFENLAIPDLANILREVATKAPDVYKGLEDGLTGTSKLMAKSMTASKSFEELGKGYTPDSPQGKVDAIVKQAMEKAGGKVKKTALLREAYNTSGAYEDEIETRRGRA